MLSVNELSSQGDVDFIDLFGLEIVAEAAVGLLLEEHHVVGCLNFVEFNTLAIFNENVTDSEVVTPAENS